MNSRSLSVVLDPQAPLDEKVALWLVVDILRATTTIITFFARGGKKLYPVQTLEEARALQEKLGKETLLMGERKGIAPKGFHLGNSPGEVTENLCTKYPRGIITTTNGTGAVLRAWSTGKPVGALSLANLSASATLLHHTSHLGILCAGRQSRTALDDTLCAGSFVHLCSGEFPSINLDDGARIALWTWQRQVPEMEQSLEESEHGKMLAQLGFQKDIALCSLRDSTSLVPLLTRDDYGPFFTAHSPFHPQGHHSFSLKETFTGNSKS